MLLGVWPDAGTARGLLRMLVQQSWAAGGTGRSIPGLSGQGPMADATRRLLGVRGPGGEHPARGDDGQPGHADPGLSLVRPAGLAGGAGERVLLSAAVQVGDPGLGDLVGEGGVHHGLR